MVFRISILVKEPDLVFDWTEKHVAATSLVRQLARSVNYNSWKAGAIISTCPADHPDAGWVVQIVVRHREVADYITSIWQPQVARCDFEVCGSEPDVSVGEPNGS